MRDQNLFDVTSLYQAFFVAQGRRARPLVLTVLSPEYLGNQDLEMGEAISQLLPSRPGSGISFERFRDISKQVVESDILSKLRDWLPFVPSHQMERALSDIRGQLKNLQDPGGFGISVFQDLVTPERYIPMPYPAPYIWYPNFWHPYFWKRFSRNPSAVRFVLLNALYWEAVEEQRLSVDPQEFAAWVEVAERLTRPRSSRIEEIVNSYLQYEVPYPLSPKLQVQKIGDFLAQLRNAIYLPLGVTAMTADQAVTAGDWVFAMKIALAGGGTVVILAAAVSLAEYLLNLQTRMTRRRR